MFFSKSIEDITYQDVTTFCNEGKPEGVYLDYKVDFPVELAKHIAAMANTLGGVILIGVKEEDDKPKPPVEGINYDNNKGYRGQIESIVHNNISPPPFLEIANCPNVSKTKTFLVIRIPQSISTPHVLKDGSIYIRTGQSSNPEKVASPDEISWLYERRKQSTTLKDNLCNRSIQRFNNFLTEVGFPRNGAGNAILELSVVPSFPNRVLFDYRLAEKLLKEITAKSGLSFREDRTRLASGGVINADGHTRFDSAYQTPFATTQVEGAFDVFELDEHGLFVLRNNATQAGTNDIPYIEVVYLVTQFLAAATMLYSHQSVGYWGFVDFNCKIDQAAGRWIDFKRCQFNLTAGGILDNSVIVESKFSVVEAEEQFNLLICKILGRLAQGCSIRSADDQFHLQILQNHRILAGLYSSVALVQ